MLTALEHCTIRTTNLDETRQFFENVLGLQQGPRPPLKMPGFWLYVGETPVIHLMEIGKNYDKDPFDQALQQEEGSGALDHIAFRGQNLKAFLQKLEDHHIEYRHASIPEIALEQVFVKEPNGIMLELNFRD
jgi:catechol 2,3-dioxygenase-like lactoylglutathione lyase family enzyme